MAETLLDEDFLTRLERLTLVSRKIFSGRMRGERRSKKRGISTEFADYRNYVAGDDIRFIDWNIYGRLDQLFLKIFLEEEDLHVHVLVDTSKSMSFGEPSKIGHARRIAAALGYVGLVNMDRVMIHGFSDTLDASSGVLRGKRMARKLFDFCGGLDADGETSLADACRRFAIEHGAGKGVVVLVSDFLDPGGYEDAVRFLVARNLDLYVIHLLAPEELDPQLQGDLRLVDCEDDTTAEISVSKPLLRRYQERLRAFRDGLSDYCAARGAPCLFSATSTPFDTVVLGSLRQGGLLR